MRGYNDYGAWVSTFNIRHHCNVVFLLALGYDKYLYFCVEVFISRMKNFLGLREGVMLWLRIQVNNFDTIGNFL